MMAMISLAAVMSKRSSRGVPLALPPSPTMHLRRKRSFMSSARPHVTWRGSSSPFPAMTSPK